MTGHFLDLLYSTHGVVHCKELADVLGGLNDWMLFQCHSPPHFTPPTKQSVSVCWFKEGNTSQRKTTPVCVSVPLQSRGGKRSCMPADASCPQPPTIVSGDKSAILVTHSVKVYLGPFSAFVINFLVWKRQQTSILYGNIFLTSVSFEHTNDNDASW